MEGRMLRFSHPALLLLLLAACDGGGDGMPNDPDLGVLDAGDVADGGDATDGGDACVSAASDFEVGSQPGGATLLADLGGSAVAGSFASAVDSASDNDLFRFTVTAPGTLSIETISVDTYPTSPLAPEPIGIGPYTLPVPTLCSPMADPQMTLIRDATLQVVVSSDDNAGAGREAYLSVAIDTLGEYFVRLESADGGTGEYVVDYRWSP